MIKILFISMMFSIYVEAKKSTNDVVLPLKSIPETLDIRELNQLDQYRVLSLLADGLFQIGDGHQYSKMIAEKVIWSKDKLQVDIYLKKGTFSDGTPLRTEEVYESLLECINISQKDTTLSFSKISGYKNWISGKEKNLKGFTWNEKKRSLKLKLDVFTPSIIDNFSLSTCSIMKKNEKGVFDLLNGSIGTGPYLLQKRTKEKIILSKNPHYFGKIFTGPTQVIFKGTNFYGDFEKEKSVFDLLLSEDKSVQDPSYNSYKQARLGAYQLSFNNEKGIFKDKELRKAFALSIDFDVLKKELGLDPKRIQRGIFPYGMAGFIKRNLLNPSYLEASRILNSKGHLKSKKLKVELIFAKKKGTAKIAQAWKKAMKNSMFDLTVIAMPQKELLNKRKAKTFEILLHGKVSSSMDGFILLTSYRSGSRFNTPLFKSKKCDRLIDSALSFYNREEKLGQYKKAEKCILDEFPIIPLYSLDEGAILIRKPWTLIRKNKYLMYPYFVHEWSKDE